MRMNLIYSKLTSTHKLKHLFFTNKPTSLNFYRQISLKPFSEQSNPQQENGHIEHLTRKLNSLYRFHETKGGMKKDSNAKTSDNEEEEKKEVKPSLASKVVKGFAKLWRDTFPREIDYNQIMSNKMEEARALKEKIIYAKDEEEIEKLESSVFDWKKTAIILIAENIVSEKKSMLSYYSDIIGEKIKNTEAYDKVKTTNTYKEYEQFKEDLDVIKVNIRENISMSYNPAVIVAKDLVDKVIVKSASSVAIEILRKQDPNFDFYELESQVKYMFKAVLDAWYKDDVERLELLTTETALGVLTGIIKTRKERKVECKFKEPLYLDEARFHNSVVESDDNVRLQFILDCQETNCLVDIEDGSIKEGSTTLIESCNYVVEIMINPEPVVDLVGHQWVVTKVERTGVVQQLI